MFTHFSYPDNNLSFVYANSPMLWLYARVEPEDYYRRLRRAAVASSSDSAVVPSSLGVAVNAASITNSGLAQASLTYSRKTNGGGGYLSEQSRYRSAGCSQRFRKEPDDRTRRIYMRTSGLANQGSDQRKVRGGAGYQAAEPVFHRIASYTATAQSTSSLFPGNTLSGLLQVVSFGIGYSPREKHLKQ